MENKWMSFQHTELAGTKEYTNILKIPRISLTDIFVSMKTAVIVHFIITRSYVNN